MRIAACGLVLGVLLLSGLAVSYGRTAAEDAAEAPPPVVEVWAPDVYPAGLAFELRASALGCTPGRWAWTVPAGCSAVKASASAILQVRCSTGGPSFTFTAKAQGGGCAATTGSASVVVSTAAAAQITLPACDGATPAAVVTLPPAGIYYRPGIQSTGRLNLQVAPGQTVRAAAECLEPKP